MSHLRTASVVTQPFQDLPSCGAEHYISGCRRQMTDLGFRLNDHIFALRAALFHFLGVLLSLSLSLPNFWILFTYFFILCLCKAKATSILFERWQIPVPNAL